jgi:hypothetical protein
MVERAQVDQVIMSTAFETKRQWIASRLHDRSKAANPDLDRPFESLAQVWEALQVYEVLADSETDPLDSLHFQRETHERAEALSKQLHELEDKFTAVLARESALDLTLLEIIRKRQEVKSEHEQVSLLKNTVAVAPAPPRAIPLFVQQQQQSYRSLGAPMRTLSSSGVSAGAPSYQSVVAAEWQQALRSRGK